MPHMHRNLKRLLNAVLVGIVVLAYFAFLALQIVSDYLLDDGFYAQALEDSRIYDRVYTELLADPEFRAVSVQLLGNLRIQDQYSREMYGHTVSALRLVLPPDTLRLVLERMIEELIAYLAGDRRRLRADLRLSSVVNDPELTKHMIAAVQAIQTELFAQALARGLASEEEIRALTPQAIAQQLERYVAELAAGNVEALPVELALVPIDQLSMTQKQNLADILLAPAAGRVSHTQRLQIEAALANNDLPGAIVLASGELLQLRIEEAVANMRRELAVGELSGVQALAELADDTSNRVVRELNATRDLVQFFRQDLILPILLAWVLSLAGLVALNRNSARDIIGLLGTILVVIGLLTFAGWSIFESRVSIPLQGYTAHQSVPNSLQHMLDDLLHALLDEMRMATYIRASFISGMGLVLLVVWTIPLLLKAYTNATTTPAMHFYHKVTLSVLSLAFGALLIADALWKPTQLVDADVQCNGHAELCDRPFNEVVFPATHNAMAAANLGWIWPHHDGDLGLQLDAGVRAFLIDIHYADTPEKIEQYLAGFPTSTRFLLRRIINASDHQPNSDGLFLCHNLCSLGATPLEETLEQVARFLNDYPNEVITLIIQDEASPEDIVQAFEQSALFPYLYAHEPGTQWPTLEDMIRNNQRLVVFAEQGSPPPAWYHHLWDNAEETLYTFRSPEVFDCAPNRGDTEQPLFLMNHWVSRRAPDRVDAAYVNSREFLLARARACQEQRGQLPNFIAVDFFSSGDLFEVVDTLNEVTDS